MYTELNKKIKSAQEDIAKYKELQNTVILLEREKETLQYNANLLYKKRRNQKKNAVNTNAKHDLAKMELTRIQQQIDAHNAQKKELSHGEHELACLCEKKKTLLLNNLSQAPQGFIEATKKCENLKANEKDLNEASEQLKQLLVSLEEVEISFNRAFYCNKPNGVYGFYHTFAKEPSINEALRSIRNFNNQIKCFTETYINTMIGARIKFDSLSFDSETLIKIMTWFQTRKNKRIAENIILAIKSALNEILSELISLQSEIKNDSKTYKRQLKDIILNLK